MRSVKYTKYLFIIIVIPLLLGGCKIAGTKVFNFFNYKNILDYATNCSVNYNISMDASYCNGTMKRPIFYNFYNSTWNEMCCTFDSRCLAKNNSNVAVICNDYDANFTYIGPVYGMSGSGSMCCNGAGQCFVDGTGSNCTAVVNASTAIATVAFNLTGTDEWNAMCCISGGY